MQPLITAYHAVSSQHRCMQVLDSALLRPGRFDRRVSVERPDRMGREQILRVHIERRQLPLSDDVSVGMVASSTVGFTGADLANLVNEAALLAGRDSKGALSPRKEDQCLPAEGQRWTPLSPLAVWALLYYETCKHAHGSHLQHPIKAYVD